MNTKYKYSQLVGIVIAYIIVCVAAIPVYNFLYGLSSVPDIVHEDSYLTEFSYYIILILFTILCLLGLKPEPVEEVGISFTVKVRADDIEQFLRKKRLAADAHGLSVQAFQ